MTKHFLHIPGGRRMEVDLRAPAGSCLACGAHPDSAGELLHDAECTVARSAAAYASRDITTDGAATFARAALLHLAREFTSEVLGSAPEQDDRETAARRADLTAGYLAGHHQAATDLATLVRVGIGRLTDDVDAWARGTHPAADDEGSQ